MVYGYSPIEFALSCFLFALIVLAFIKRNWLIAAAGFYFAFLLAPVFKLGTWEEAITGTGTLTIIVLIVFYKKKKKQKKIEEYQTTEYFKDTHNDYDTVMHKDLGKYGEFLIYDNLKELQTNGTRFLFNIYIPKKDGRTTEIDAIVISTSGLFVIESKNYSGWIFGNRDNEQWTQTFPTGRKNQFYNPIKQNTGHCKYLENYLNMGKMRMISYIVFSDRCEFKRIPDNTNEYRIIHREHLLHYIKEDMERNTGFFTIDQVNYIYSRLFPLTQIDGKTKQEHIKNVSDITNS